MQDATQITETSTSPGPNTPTPNAAPQPTNNLTQNAPTKTNKKKAPIIITIIILLILLIGGVILFFALSNNTSKDDDANTDSSQTDQSKKAEEKETAKDAAWKSLDFSIDGHKKQLPLTEEELLADLDGWKIRNTSLSIGGSYTTLFVEYYGPTRATKPPQFQFRKNNKTNKIYMLYVDFMGEGKDRSFEIGGINESFTEKEMRDLLGEPTPYSTGDYISKDRYAKNIWTYFYYANGKDEEDGVLSMTGYSREGGYLRSLTLTDKKDSPKADD